MAENPLLPNAELRALLDLTKRCLALDATAARRSRRPPAPAPLPGREALLAGTALQLKPGDILIGERADSTTAALAAQIQSSGRPAQSPLPETGTQSPRLLLAAAMAAALRHAGTDRLVLAYTREHASEPHWTSALAWAQQRQLPLILACADPRGEHAFRAATRAAKDAFSWDKVTTTARRLRVPVLTVDGGDAVAVYRTMQESILRARAADGPAILWAMLPPPTGQAAKPLGRLQQYLRTRRIAF